MSWPKTETELLEAVPAWLEARGNKVFTEVRIPGDDANPVADIVTLKDGRASVFEGKRSLSVHLIRQAYWWIQYADAVSVIIPAPATKSMQEERTKCYPVLQGLGLGLLEVRLDGKGHPIPELILNPKPQPAGRSGHLLDCIDPRASGVKRPQQRPNPPGVSAAHYVKSSPYNATIDALCHFIQRNPGTALKDAVRSIEHHWPTHQKAISQLSRIACESGIRGIRTENQHGLTILYPI